MSDLGPSGNDPDAGMQPDVGADLHLWTTRWEQIEEARTDDAPEALADAADLLDEMFSELDIPTRPTEAPETEDLVKAREQIRDVLDRLSREAPVDREEVDDAFDEARRTFDLLATGRHAGGQDAAI
ncbi:MAG TPA: hypothetical protein VFX13_06665 [Gaiellales bacterium]|nr:hypothetical protein [Gaiellales bacterium]